ncbi:MAG: hypothetical protein HYU97_10630 [Deltaproteobacteria bacterium]|nr:hypothetical protein [Deltaproteobacteria bacterium]
MTQAIKPAYHPPHSTGPSYSKKIQETSSSYDYEGEGEIEENQETQGQLEDLYQYAAQDVLQEYLAAKSAVPPSSFVIINGKVYSIAMIEQYLAAMHMLPQNLNQGGNTGQSVAGQGTIPEPGFNKQMNEGNSVYAQAQAMAEDLRAKGYPPDVIFNMLMQAFGNAPGVTPEDLQYFSQGFGAYDPYGSNPQNPQNPQYAAYTKAMHNGQGYPYYDPWFQSQTTQKMQQESESLIHDAKKQEKAMLQKMHIIKLQIAMGDFVGAWFSLLVLNDRDTRESMKKAFSVLEKIRDARAILLREMGRMKPVKPYVGDNPRLQANNTYKQMRYNQMVTVNTQLLQELQTPEREVLDGQIASLNQWNRQLWESYANFRDAYWRTTDRVIQKQ